MNKHALPKCENTHVRIRPMAKRFDGGPNGPELPPIDYDWRVGIVTDAGVPFSNSSINHGTTLGFDHIHHYTSDPQRGPGYGFLTLNVQISIGGRELWIEPCRLPGT